jgi:hypothetical protein
MTNSDEPRVAKLTPARRSALAVLAGAARFEARESNQTGRDGHGDPVIYWQSREWLEANGLIREKDGQPGWYVLTAAGVERAGTAGLLPPGAS